MVGTTGFEPATPCPPDKCATRLRYAPKCLMQCPAKAEHMIPDYGGKTNVKLVFEDLENIFEFDSHLANNMLLIAFFLVLAG